MDFTYKYLDQLNRLISNSDVHFKSKIKKRLSGNIYAYYQYYNATAASIIRIRETSKYLENFKFRKDNDFKQAFDFYEFINCISIVFECMNELFSIYNLKLCEEYKKTNIKVFKLSNRTKQDDITFFKFIRSASAVHPVDTTRYYEKINKNKIEVFPYALWIEHNVFAKMRKNYFKEADIELLSWSGKTSCKYNYYYLVIDEFNGFLRQLLELIEVVYDKATLITKNYEEKIRCKRLKNEDDFNSYAEYLLYLKNRLKVISNKYECPDGGLLIASHIVNNSLISDDFKNYVKLQVKNLEQKMKTDITSIGYDDIFEDINIKYIMKKSDRKKSYRCEKFYDYLKSRVENEILSSNFECYRDYLKEKDYNKLQIGPYAIYLILEVKDNIFSFVDVDKAETFSDFYEMTLEEVYYKKLYNKSNI